MLIRIAPDDKVVATRSISNKVRELEFLADNPTFIDIGEFHFVEAFDMYEYVNDTIQLKEGWETIKNDRVEAALLISIPIALQKAKDDKIALIRSTAIDALVVVDGNTYDGGRDSVRVIREEIKIASIENESDVGIWDIDENIIYMSPVKALTVAKTIQKESRTNNRDTKSRIVEVKAIEINPVGTYPTYEDAKAAIDLI